MIALVCYALKLNYEILEIHELIIYPEQETIFNPVMKLLSSYKIRNSIDKNDYTDDINSLNELLTEINYNMEYDSPELKLSQHNISLNPAQRFIFKTILNR